MKGVMCLIKRVLASVSSPFPSNSTLFGSQCAVQLQMPLDYLSTLSLCLMLVTHSELHNCTLWHRSLRSFGVKFLLSLQDIIQYVCPPTWILSALPGSWNHRDREPWEVTGSSPLVAQMRK